MVNCFHAVLPLCVNDMHAYCHEFVGTIYRIGQMQTVLWSKIYSYAPVVICTETKNAILKMDIPLIQIFLSLYAESIGLFLMMLPNLTYKLVNLVFKTITSIFKLSQVVMLFIKFFM